MGSRPILKRLASGAFWILLGTAVTRAISLLTNIIIARLLGKEDFGAYGIINSTLETFSLFGGLALGFTMIKYTAEYRVRDRIKAGQLLSSARTIAYVTTGIIAASLFLFSDLLAASTLNRPDLGGMLKIGAAYMFIRTVNNIQLGTLAGFEAFRETARINVVTGFLTPLLTLPLVYWMDLTGAVIAMVAVAFVSYAYCGRVFKQKCEQHGIVVRLLARSSFKALPELLRFSIPAFMSWILVIPVAWLTQALLANQHSGYSELGLFNAANQWRQFVILIPTMMSTVMLAVSADSYANAARDAYRQAYRMNMMLTWCYALPAAVLVSTLAGLLNSLFGASFADAVLLIPPLIAAAFFSVLNTVASSAVTGAGRMWAEVSLNMIWAIVLIATSLWLVPVHGAMGLAYASLVAPVVQVIARLCYIDRALIPNSLHDFRLLLIVTIIVIGATLFLSWESKLNTMWGLLLTAFGSIPLLLKARDIYSKVKNS
jgi:O-antigen/teichoic acid export membrane protein